MASMFKTLTSSMKNLYNKFFHKKKEQKKPFFKTIEVPEPKIKVRLARVTRPHKYNRMGTIYAKKTIW